MAADKNAKVMDLMMRNMEKERKELQKENESLQSRVKEMKTAYCQCQKTKDELAKELSEAEDRIMLFEKREGQKHEHNEAEYFELENRLQQVEEEYARLVEKNKEDLDTNSELIEQLQEVQELSSGKDRILNDLNSQYSKSVAQINILQEENRKLNEALKREREAVSQLADDKLSLEQNILDVLGQVNELEHKIENKTSETFEKDHTITKIKHYTSELLQEQKFNAEQVTFLKDELETTKSELDGTKTKVEEFRKECKRHKDELMKCKDSLEGEFERFHSI